MKAAKKRERATSALEKFLAKAGVSQETIEEAKEIISDDRHAVSMQAEAVLLSLESAAKFTKKLCKRCGESFATNYRYVAYCSDNCRAKHLQSQTGIKWDPTKPAEERWGHEFSRVEPPLVIPPVALVAMEKAYQEIGMLLQFQSQIQTLTPSEEVPHLEFSEQSLQPVPESPTTPLSEPDPSTFAFDFEQ